MKDVGLVDVTAAVSTATFGLGDPAEFLWQYINLTPMAPFVARAPAAAQEALQCHVVESWQQFVVKDTMTIDQPMVIASGQK